MRLAIVPVALVVGAVFGSLTVPARAAPAGAAAAPATDVAIDDARRAAAQRLLAASRFRARQEVLLDDSIRAGQSDLLSDCVARAGEGLSLAGCDATGRPDAGMAARLAARRTAMLDEIMVASQTVYARRFTAAEMDQITAFFLTPIGRKYGQVYPDVIAEVQTRKHAIIRKYLVAAARPARGARPR